MFSNTRIFSLLALVLITTSCGKSQSTGLPSGGSATPETSAISVAPEITSIALVPATVSQCSYGGSVMMLFKDSNFNGIFDLGEVLVSQSPICNGAQGVAGISAGVEVKAAPFASCSAGGTVVNTFQDLNSNGFLDLNESVASSSTICNGVNGTNGSSGVDGKSSVLVSSVASYSQCPAGGFVYTTQLDGHTSQVNVVCNGVNGSDGQDGSNGQNASFSMGAVGPQVKGQEYSACHHDYLYIPEPEKKGGGWLIFRHQKNGTEDHGIGSTGFNVWNVDISDFALRSEVKKVMYCKMHWDASERKLFYEVVTDQDGYKGEQGAIGL